MKDELNTEGQSLLRDEKLQGITGGKGGDDGIHNWEPNVPYSNTQCVKVYTSACAQCEKWLTSNCVSGFEKL